MLRIFQGISSKNSATNALRNLKVQTKSGSTISERKLHRMHASETEKSREAVVIDCYHMLNAVAARNRGSHISIREWSRLY